MLVLGSGCSPSWRMEVFLCARKCAHITELSTCNICTTGLVYSFLVNILGYPCAISTWAERLTYTMQSECFGFCIDNRGTCKSVHGIMCLIHLTVHTGLCVQSSMLSPCSDLVRSNCIQRRCTQSWRVAAASLLGGFLMNSKTLITMSNKPLWFGCEKCLPMVFVRS